MFNVVHVDLIYFDATCSFVRECFYFFFQAQFLLLIWIDILIPINACLKVFGLSKSSIWKVDEMSILNSEVTGNMDVHVIIYRWITPLNLQIMSWYC